jgi:hypothetical protein
MPMPMPMQIMETELKLRMLRIGFHNIANSSSAEIYSGILSLRRSMLCADDVPIAR